MNIIKKIIEPIYTLFAPSQTASLGALGNTLTNVPQLLTIYPVLHYIATDVVSSDVETDVLFICQETGIEQAMVQLTGYSLWIALLSSNRILVNALNANSVALTLYQSCDYGSTWQALCSENITTAGIQNVLFSNIPASTSNLLKITIKNSTTGTGLTNTVTLYMLG